MKYNNSDIESNPYTRLNLFSPGTSNHTHEFFEFVLFLEGEHMHSINGRETPSTTGDFAIIRPTDIHWIKFIDKTCKYRDFYVSIEKMQKVCRLFSEDFFDTLMAQNRLTFKVGINEINTIESKAIYFNRLFLDNKTAEKQLDQIHSSIIVDLLSRIVIDKLHSESTTPSWLEVLLLRMTYYDYITYSVDDIVKITGYSHSYICQMFKKHYNTTLIAYHNKMKIQYSVKLIWSMKLNEIAAMLGWENPKNFTIAFKKVYGVTPSQYKKRRSLNL